MSRYTDIILNVMGTLAAILMILFLISFSIKMFMGFPSNNLSATTAKPIAQQKIGDDVNPDILIIYEAEIDGVKVYPSVIKEAE